MFLLSPGRVKRVQRAVMVALLAPLPCLAHASAPVPADEGKFTFTLQESEIGTDTFKMDATGSVDSRVAVTLPGLKLDTHNTLKLQTGRLTSIFTEAVGHGKFEWTRSGQTGKLTVDSKPFKDQALPTPVYPLGSFTPHLYSYLVAAYDLRRGGPQRFEVVNIDGVGPTGLATLKVTITALGAKPRQVGGKTVPISRYSLVLPGPIGNVDTEVDTDIKGHVLLWSVPAQKLFAVRDGYADLLLPETPSDPLLSKPTFPVKIEHAVMVAMRDGIKLAADVYRPNAEGKFPVILERTPYGRENALEANSYAKRGYVFVAQDVRGRFGSEGEFHPFVQEATDGYDTVEWCAAQPWSTGDVGMIGGSYLGFVQWAAAREGSKHLKCLIPIVSPPDPFFNVPYAFGEFFLSPALWWADAVKDRNSISIQSPTAAFKNMAPFKTLPLTNVDKAVLGRHIPFFQEWLKHSTNDAYYDQVNFNDRMKLMGPLPALHVSGWFDGDGIGTKLNYAAMVASGHPNQKLIYGPWAHAVNTTTRIGAFDFGPQSLRDLDTLYLRWFDHWLKGVNNGMEKEPPVVAFLIGRNEWRTFSAWPPKEATLQKWFFHSTGHANAGSSGGALSTVVPSVGEPADHYTYNPQMPYIPAALAKVANAEAGADEAFEFPERRPDLLYYTTPVLKADLVVAGPISLHLVASTSVKDTDWFAILEDVYPDGRFAALCQGIIRARFRKSFTTPTLLQSNEVADYNIDLWALGNVFKKGHRLRVMVTSSYFPVYARNLNTGGDLATETKMVIAHQTIYHAPGRASYLLLPVLPK